MNLCVNCQHHSQEWQFLFYAYDVPITQTVHYCNAYAHTKIDFVTGEEKVLDARVECDKVRDVKGKYPMDECSRYKEFIPTMGYMKKEFIPMGYKK